MSSKKLRARAKALAKAQKDKEAEQRRAHTTQGQHDSSNPNISQTIPAPHTNQPQNSNHVANAIEEKPKEKPPDRELLRLIFEGMGAVLLAATVGFSAYQACQMRKSVEVSQNQLLAANMVWVCWVGNPKIETNEVGMITFFRNLKNVSNGAAFKIQAEYTNKEGTNDWTMPPISMFGELGKTKVVLPDSTLYVSGHFYTEIPSYSANRFLSEEMLHKFTIRYYDAFNRKIEISQFLRVKDGKWTTEESECQYEGYPIR